MTWRPNPGNRISFLKGSAGGPQQTRGYGRMEILVVALIKEVLDRQIERPPVSRPATFPARRQVLKLSVSR